MGVTEGTEMAIRIMYSLTNMPGNEMSSENIALTDPNIIYYVAGDCSTGVVIPTAPTTAAPTPRIFAAGKTITIFSDVNNQLAGIDYNPFWGQSTLVTFDTIDNNNTMKYANFNYQGTDFGFDINAASMDSLHIDLWSETAFSLNLFPICRTQAQGEKSFTITVTAGEWNSIDIPVSYFTNLGLDMSGIFQLKMDGGAGQTFYIDNIYFYTISVDVDSEIPTDFTAVPGTITHNSIELILNAADNSGSINYTIINGLDTMHTAGVSETDKSFIVRNLEESTAYTFYVIAADATGNSTDTITVSVSTIAGPAKPTTAAPAPTAAQEDVISIYSNHYDAATTFAFGSWGQSTIASFYNIDEEEMIKLEEFNYLGLELNGNEANFDASEMTHLHIDVWTPNGTSFQITPIWGSEAIYTCTPLETETWNSFDIALTNFASIDLTNIYQIKLVGNGTHYLDNIYFYKANETSLEEVTSNVTVYSKNGTLYLNDINGETVTIFTTTGQCIYMNQQVDNTLQVNLEKGIYLVRVGTKTMKVVL